MNTLISHIYRKYTHKNITSPDRLTSNVFTCNMQKKKNK